MQSISARLAAPVTAAVLAFSSLALASEREDFERTLDFDRGGRLELSNANGDITIETWDQPSVRIQAEKEARSEDALRDIEISIEGSGSSVRIETIHHRRRGGGQVSYHITLPVEANVEARTANGDVSITGIHGEVEAHSTNGGLRVENIEGEIEASTTNGSIRASYDRAVGGRHRFSTTNGSVRVYLPSDAGGELDAETVNGSIEVDFPVTVNRTSRRHLRGRFGNGDGTFEISTVNGSVKILEN